MYIKIRALTDQKTEYLEVLDKDTIRISVKDKAERNMANTRILELLREHFSGQVVRLVSGHHSPSKIVSVE